MHANQLLRILDLWNPKVKTMTDAQLAAYYCDARHRAKVEFYDDAYDAIATVIGKEIMRRDGNALATVNVLLKAGRSEQIRAYMTASQELEGTWDE